MPVTLSCLAQPDRPLTTDETTLLDNVAYLRYMIERCPLPQQTAEALYAISMGVGRDLPRVDKAVAQSILAKAEARASNDIAASKPEACQNARRAADSLAEDLMTRKPKESK